MQKKIYDMAVYISRQSRWIEARREGRRESEGEREGKREEGREDYEARCFSCSLQTPTLGKALTSDCGYCGTVPHNLIHNT